jgi:hypothetical protein
MALISPSTNPWPFVILSLLLLSAGLAVFATLNLRDSGEGSAQSQYGWPVRLYRGFEDGREGGRLDLAGILIDLLVLLGLAALALTPAVWALQRRARRILEDIS